MSIDDEHTAVERSCSAALLLNPLCVRATKNKRKVQLANPRDDYFDFTKLFKTPCIQSSTVKNGMHMEQKVLALGSITHFQISQVTLWMLRYWPLPQKLHRKIIADELGENSNVTTEFEMKYL